MSRPGGNLTGVTIMTSDLNPKRLEVLSEMASQARVIALLVNSQHAGAERTISEVRMAANARGLRIKVVTATSEDEYEPAFAQARAEAGALLLANDPVFFSRRERLVPLAARYRLPAMYEWREFVELGGLMSSAPASRDDSRTRPLCRSRSGGDAAGRSADIAADHIRICNKPQDCARARPRRAAIAARARRRGDRISGATAGLRGATIEVTFPARPAGLRARKSR